MQYTVVLSVVVEPLAVHLYALDCHRLSLGSLLNTRASRYIGFIMLQKRVLPSTDYHLCKLNYICDLEGNELKSEPAADVTIRLSAISTLESCSPSQVSQLSIADRVNLEVKLLCCTRDT